MVAPDHRRRVRSRARTDNGFNREIDHLVERLVPTRSPSCVEALGAHSRACRRNGGSEALAIQPEQHRAHAFTPSFGRTEQSCRVQSPRARALHDSHQLQRARDPERTLPHNFMRSFDLCQPTVVPESSGCVAIRCADETTSGA